MRLSSEQKISPRPGLHLEYLRQRHIFFLTLLFFTSRINWKGGKEGNKMTWQAMCTVWCMMTMWWLPFLFHKHIQLSWLEKKLGMSHISHTTVRYDNIFGWVKAKKKRKKWADKKLNSSEALFIHAAVKFVVVLQLWSTHVCFLEI